MAPVLDVVGIVTSDLAASLAFYRRLGLPIPDGAQEQAHVEVSLPGGLRLCWDPVSTIHAFDPSWTAPAEGSGHRASLAFCCADPAEVDAVHAELVGAGYTSKHDPWDAFWGQRYATVLDPDGLPVDLYAPLAGPPETP